MRIVIMAALVGALCACSDGGEGPGVTGLYFTRFEAVPFEGIVASNVGSTGSLVRAAPGGRQIVDFGDDGVHLFDPATASSVFRFERHPQHVLRDGFLAQESADAPLSYTTDGVTWEPVPLPEDLLLQSAMTDPATNTLVVAGVGELVLGSGDLVGRVYSTTDLGATWVMEGNLMQPVQGTAASTTLVGVAGVIVAGVCPVSGLYEGGSPVCETYRLHDGQTDRGFVFDAPTPIGWDADGRIVGTARIETSGRDTIPGLALFDPEDAAIPGEAQDHFHTTFLPQDAELREVDADGHLWVAGWDLLGWSVRRSVAPLGSENDARDEVLAGWGCESYYRAEIEGGYTGDPMELTITNGGDEPFALFKVLGYRPQQAYPDGNPVFVEPGSSITLEQNDEEWLMALTADGRCMGYGMAKKLNGRTLP